MIHIKNFILVIRKKAFKYQLANQQGYIVNKYIDKATGAHFNLPGHSPADLRCTVLERVKVKGDLYRH